MGKYRKYSPETKVRIVLEILRGEKSVAKASRDYQIKDSLLYRWKDEFLEGGKQAFTFGQTSRAGAPERTNTAELERQVGKYNATGNCKKIALCEISTTRKR